MVVSHVTCTVETKVQYSARAANVLNYSAISSDLQNIYFHKAFAYSSLPQYDNTKVSLAIPQNILQAKPSMVINLQNESVEMYEKSLYSNVHQLANISHENKNIF